MDVIDAIKKRKSTRKFSGKKVPEEMIKDIVEAGKQAPSGNNKQPWRFSTVIAREMDPKLFAQDFVTTASHLVVCAADPAVYTPSDWDDPNEVRAIRDLSIASGFIVLRATELGLATCYIGWLKREDLKKFLNLPDEWVLPYVIAVGYE